MRCSPPSCFSAILPCLAQSQVSTPVSRCMHCHEDVPIENVNSHWCINRRREPTSRRIEGFPAVRRSSSCDLRELASSIADVDIEPPTEVESYAESGFAGPDCFSDAGTLESLSDEADDVDPWSALARDQLLVLDGTGPPSMSDPVEVRASSAGRSASVAGSALGASDTQLDDESDPWSALARDQELTSMESTGKLPSLTSALPGYPDRRSPESSQSSSSVHARVHTDSVDDALVYCDFGPSPSPNP